MAFEAAHGGQRTAVEVRRRLEIDPEGTFLARADDGRAVGAGSVVLHRDAGEGAYAFVGGMMVDEGARRQGIARALLRAGVMRARERGALRVALAASAAGRPLYLQEGFRDVATSRRYELRAEPKAPPASRRYAIYPISSCEIMELLRYDAPRFGASRAPLIASLMGAFPERSFVAFERAGGAIAGYACTQERVVGPLVADDPEAAALLLHAAVQAGAPRKALATGLSPAAEAMLSARGWTPDGTTCALMVQGDRIPGRHEAVFGMGAWAIG
ncbi:MAG: hypothetical protein QOE90_2855 [Thermoplasmata archaeon]|nr:hypothetical protein [Thermoplasmata archaeon]